MMRLQKYIAACGVCSRRAAEEMIKEGRVTVNGETASLGVSVCETDRVLVDGAEISLTEDKLYILLFKPVGVVTTAKDERGRKTVLDLLNIEERVYPVGRLDINTSGLLLLTNDGDLANRLTHPKFNVDKTYKAVVEGEITSAKLKELENGVVLENGLTAPAKAKLIKFEGGKSYVEITIHEGRNRQVRRMFEAVGCRVKALRRIKLGSLTLKGLEKGEYRYLTKEEIEYLKNLTRD